MRSLKTTKSICPEDVFERLDAELFVDNDNRVIISKNCPEHGSFEDVYWSDFTQFKKVERFRDLGNGVALPRKTEKGCPYDCGLCESHKSRTTLLIVDVTNRCNLSCPICFAHAGKKGYVYEPSKEQVKDVLEYAQEVNHPVKIRAVQFSGGEPTIREDLPELVRVAKEAGYEHVEVNTNGVVIAKKGPSYIRELRRAGTSTLYLQFDGLKREIYEETRGLDLLPVKQKVIEHAREAGLDSIVLVVTLVGGVNDDDLGNIIRYGTRNSDVVRCVNVQPVSISGRIDRSKREKMRITLPDFTRLCEEQTDGQVTRDDFYTVPTINMLSKVLNYVLRGGQRYYPEFTCHPHCGLATFVFVKGEKVVPITRYIDVDGLYEDLKKMYENAERTKKIPKKRKLVYTFLKRTSLSFLPKLPKVYSLLKSGSYESAGRVMRGLMMIGGMHFMDPYNFDLERVQSCCIHYGVPDKKEKGRLIPFCTMNSIHRDNIEREFSIPLEEYKGL
ncbi:MAG: radical SAM protein [Candidatus Aenigmarchaeota archaeon]|nr:radical SAM protein [Candidatus Aenigmarchaeota archaeon]